MRAYEVAEEVQRNLDELDRRYKSYERKIFMKVGYSVIVIVGLCLLYLEWRGML